MKLGTLLTGVVSPQNFDTDIAIRTIQFDSRLIEPGDLFVATRGTASDGHDYIL